jgi:predicted transcriptional regulator
VAKVNPTQVAADIVAAFVSNNSLQTSELAAVIETVHAAVEGLQEGTEAAPVVIEAPAPAVSIRKSVTPDYLICLDDGKQFRSLKRHLASLGLTPEQYRAKWSLPSTYPMVAPNYAAQRSALAKANGLGQIRARSVAAPPVSAGASEVTTPASARVGVNEVVAATPASVGTIAAAAPEPPIVAKGKKTKPRIKQVVAPPQVAAKRKPGRPPRAKA